MIKNKITACLNVDNLLSSDLPVYIFILQAAIYA